MKAWRIFSLMFIVIFLGIILLVAQGYAQSDMADNMKKRLTALGIPVKSVKLKDQSLPQLEIILQSSKKKGEWSSSDFWNDHLARREAELNYQTQSRLSGYTIITIDPDGKQIGWTQTYLDPTIPSQTPKKFRAKKPDNKAVEEAITKNIQLSGLHLDYVKVTTGIGSSTEVQLAEIHLWAENKETANGIIQPFVYSIRPLISQINQEISGARVGVVWVFINDRQGQPLLEYLWDTELDIERGGVTEGVTPWYTAPLSAEELLAQPTSVATPATIQQAYPSPIPYP